MSEVPAENGGVTDRRGQLGRSLPEAELSAVDLEPRYTPILKAVLLPSAVLHSSTFVQRLLYFCRSFAPAGSLGKAPGREHPIDGCKRP
jgi:hypothetical protein